MPGATVVFLNLWVGFCPQSARLLPNLSHGACKDHQVAINNVKLKHLRRFCWLWISLKTRFCYPPLRVRFRLDLARQALMMEPKSTNQSIRLGPPSSPVTSSCDFLTDLGPNYNNRPKKLLYCLGIAMKNTICRRT